MVRRLFSSAAASTRRAGVVSTAVSTPGGYRPAARPAMLGYCPRREQPLARRRLQSGRCIQGQGACRRSKRWTTCIAAMEASPLNAFSHTDFERARAAARRADVSLPFGGVPFGIKELEKVAGWPHTEASMIFKDRIATHDDTSVARLRVTGAVLAAQTTAPEFGGINCTSTELHGTTRNPWNPERTPGGSSGGTAAAVAGGLLPVATGSDGGGSIRGPAGFSGLFGLKATYGRIPKGPDGTIEPMTTVLGCLTRSVRDTARYFDACNGFDARDPLSLPRVDGWEAGLGSHDLEGLTGAVVVDLGIAQVRDDVAAAVVEAAERLAGAAGLRLVPVTPTLPPLRGAWAMANQPPMVADLGDAYPDRIDELSREIAAGLESARERYTLERAASIERYRRQLNGAMADALRRSGFRVLLHPSRRGLQGGRAPTVHPARARPYSRDRLRPGHHEQRSPHGAVESQREPGRQHPGRDGRRIPVGLQVLAGHHREPLLLDLALVAERAMPWPLVAPGSPLARGV